MVTVMMLFGLIVALLLMPLETLAQVRPPIIDMHLHTYPIGSHWPKKLSQIGRLGELDEATVP